MTLRRHQASGRFLPARPGLAPAILPFLFACALAGAPPAEPATGTGALVRGWLQTERAIQEAEDRWVFERGILKDRQDVLREEIERLRARIDEDRRAAAQSEGDRRALETEMAGIEAWEETLRATLADAVRRLRALIVLLPQAEQASLANELATVELPGTGPAEATQAVLTTLRHIEDFHGTVSPVREPIVLPDGRRLDGEVIFFGLGAAVATSPDGSFAAVGLPEPGEGWTWTPTAGLVEAARELRAILTGASEPHFVRVPGLVPAAPDGGGEGP